MKAPLVSILIPFKNSQDFLDECLTSIINQSYTNWEVVIIDDHSTDKSYELVATFAQRDQRIRLFKNIGKGIIEALRCALNLSQGNLISRMDSDDIMMPNRLDVMVNNLLNFGTGHVALGQVRYFRKEGISNGYERYEAWLNLLTSEGNNYSEIYKECVIPSPCWMTYKSDLLKAEAFYPNKYPEDYDLTFRFYQYNLKCIACSKVLHLWRDYDTRTSRTHKHYAQNYFLDIKTHYFLKLDRDAKRPLAIWGAGYKGKQIAKLLIAQSVHFYWICDNPKKIGKHIYGQELLNFNYLEKLEHPQSIVTVANEKAQKEIRSYFNLRRMVSMKDYYFFC